MRLCDRDIELALDSGRIRIDPRPDMARITGISVDLRLGNRFQVFHNDHTAGFIDVSGPRNTVEQAIETVMGREIVLTEQDCFFLHPGELALAMTVEHIELPDDLVGWLDGRSSLARLGLMVHATAHRIDPGWRGVIVLECFNSGKLPLALRPGMTICAINFEMMTGPCARPYHQRSDAKYRQQAGPTPSRIGQDQQGE